MDFHLFILVLALAGARGGDPPTSTNGTAHKQLPRTIPPNLIDRFPELTTLDRKNTYVQAQTVLEYKPIVSSYHPHPVTLAQIIPPGTPWPASAAGFTEPPNLVDRFPEPSSAKTTTEAPSTHLVLTYKPTRPSFLPQPGVTVGQIVPDAKPATTSPHVTLTYKPSRPPHLGDQTPNLVDRFPDLSSTKVTTEAPSTHLVLTYKPTRPSFLPQPGVTIGQIVPPGQPLPAGPETTTAPPPNLVDRFPELSTKVTTKPPRTHLVLTYKPTRPSFLPQPGVTIGQIVPPGQALPAGPETSTATPPNLVDRFPDSVTATPTTASTRIILTYKPQRPWYHPRPGNTLGQIVPPGKPWPASPEGYSSFSATTHPPWLADSLSHSKNEDLQSLKEEVALPEPNALQYEGPPITAPPHSPFTSGTQKTTLSDIVDILKEVHNITIVSTPPTNSQDGGSQHNYGVVVRHHDQAAAAEPIHVYDGTAAFHDLHESRVFQNPKLQA